MTDICTFSFILTSTSHVYPLLVVLQFVCVIQPGQLSSSVDMSIVVAQLLV